jgi:hypothetical protein
MMMNTYRVPPPRKRRYIEVVDYCRHTLESTGVVPSYSMIRDALRIYDNGTVRKHVKEAEAAGLITLADYRGGRGPRAGQRIRLGTPQEAAEGRQTIKLGSEVDQ